jgi:hypothetical protein
VIHDLWNKRKTMNFDTPIPFAEAMEKLATREIMPTRLGTAQLRMLDVAIRERAFFSAKVESARLLQSMRDYCEEWMLADRAIEGHGGLRRTGRAEFVADMREIAIREGLGVIDPATGEIDPNIREDDLTDIRSLSRLQLIFDTVTEQAQEYGYFIQGQSPEILDVFPAQRFIRVRPVAAPRPYHAANEGVVRRKDDPFWVTMNRDFGVPWGPWGFNSGMGVEDVDRDEAIALGVIKERDTVKPLDMQPFNAGVQASVRDLDGDITAALARSTGGTVAGSALRMKTSFKEAVLPHPSGQGTIEIDDEILENLQALDKDKAWGGAKALATLAPENRTRLLNDERARLAGAMVEESALVTAAGKYIPKTGNKNSVPWDTLQLSGAVMTHTHPNGGSLGPEDISLLLTQQMAAVRAVGGGRIYSATKGRITIDLKEGEDITRDTPAGRQAVREATAVMRRMLGDRGTELERSQLLTRLVWARLHQRGIIRYEEETL